MKRRRCDACGKCWHVERYRVHDALWPAGQKRLHMRCLEKIIGRDLAPADLSDDKRNTEWKPKIGDFVFLRDRHKSRAMYDHGRLVRRCPDGDKWFVLLVDGKVHTTWGLMQRIWQQPVAFPERREAIMNAVLPPYFGTEDLEAAAHFAWSALHNDDFDAHGNFRPGVADHQRRAWQVSHLRAKHVLAYLNNPLVMMEESLGTLDEGRGAGHGPGTRDAGAVPAEG